MEADQEFTCPHCWQMVTMRIDVSAGSQRYIQDCEVCCNPLEIAYRVQNYEVMEFDARSIEQ